MFKCFWSDVENRLHLITVLGIVLQSPDVYWLSSLIGVGSQTVALTPVPLVVTQGTPVTLTCTYTEEGSVLYCGWNRNGTQLTRLSSTCEEQGGVIDSTLYSYTCPVGRVCTWTIKSVMFEERMVEWSCRIWSTNSLSISNMLNIDVQGKRNYLLSEYKMTQVQIFIHIFCRYIDKRTCKQRWTTFYNYVIGCKITCLIKV